ncbi:hypothetical protein, partial [Neisseria gonorrhoeae]|uniref:hypothetical protein n=1 Tax=Neisseria gonorrhoeae TaxID=485 RepID=UPI0034DD815F
GKEANLAFPLVVFSLFGTRVFPWFFPSPPPPPAGMGKHQDGGIKRGMAENLPFQSFIHILFLKFAFAGRRAANAGVR